MGRVIASAPKLNTSRTLWQANIARLPGREAPASNTGELRLKRAFSGRADRPPTWLRLLLELCCAWWGNLSTMWRPLYGATAAFSAGPVSCGRLAISQASGSSDGQSMPPARAGLPAGGLRFGKVRGMCLYGRSPDEAAQVEQLGARLRNLREALGCTRMEFAQQLKLDLELIVAVENGYGNLETAKRLIDLAGKIPPARSAPL